MTSNACSRGSSFEKIYSWKNGFAEIGMALCIFRLYSQIFLLVLFHAEGPRLSPKGKVDSTLPRSGDSRPRSPYITRTDSPSLLLPHHLVKSKCGRNIRRQQNSPVQKPLPHLRRDKNARRDHLYRWPWLRCSCFAECACHRL